MDVEADEATFDRTDVTKDLTYKDADRQAKLSEQDVRKIHADISDKDI